MPGLNRVTKWATTKTHPTIFHITHYKAGSQWIHRILHALTPNRIVSPDPLHHQFFDRPLVQGGVYPTLYLTREQFQSVKLPSYHRKFIMIRDLRDTVVSLYFSMRFSHEILSDRMRKTRETLNEMSKEEGLLYLIETHLTSYSQILWSWIAAGEKLFKYEELLQDDEGILAEILLGRCRMDVSLEHLRNVIRANRFEATSGRKPGKEDTNSHERKGIAGDWRNHFTEEHRVEFKKRFGSVLIATGYEKGFNW